ncbi:MAG: nucleotidyltransferase family protein [Oscillospiraceae bacterium]|nr:nucleotidyltransferase family protein [Oscillospiraceae bacterium]
MTHEEYRAAVRNIVYLAACMVNGQAPDADRVREMDREALYQMADRHLLTGITAMALESAGVRDEAFTQAKGKAIRKVAAMDVERAAVLDALGEAGIWYVPLKGCVLKDLYPKLGMRQMADNDILYDASRTKDVQSLMEALGFEADLYPKGIHDHYFKPPVCNFELHRTLFSILRDEALFHYYADVTSRLLPDAGRRFGYHFSDEDFYVYMLAHEYKHYSGGGTGLRSLLDTYVYCKQKGDSLDWAYVAGELDKLGIADFAELNRSLSLHLFDGKPLTEPERDMLEYILFSGVYGNAVNLTKNRIAKKGRLGYLLSRAFLPYKIITNLYPILKKLPFLLPFCWVVRWVKALRVKPKTVLFQFKAAFKY